MRKNVSVFVSYLKYYLKTMLVSRGDFFTWLLGGFLYEICLLFFIFILYANVENLNGWTLYELLLIKGLFNLTYGIYFLFYRGFVYVFSERYIIEGNLTMTLIRPINPYVLIMAENAGVTEFITPMIGLVLMGLAFVHLSIPLTFAHLGLMVLAVICGVFILGGLCTIFASLSFFVQTKTSIMEIMESVMELGMYPVTIYNSLIRFLVTFVIPIGLVAYLPVNVMLHASQSICDLIWLPVAATILFGLGLMLWKMGLTRYNGSAT